MPRLLTNKLGERLMCIGTVDSRYSVSTYSMRALQCAEDTSDEGTLLVIIIATISPVDN